MNIKDYLQNLRIERSYLSKFINNHASYWLKQELQLALTSIDIEIDKYTQILQKRQIKDLQKASEQLSLFERK